MNKIEYMTWLQEKAAEEDYWAERLKDNHEEMVGHRAAGWAFRVALIRAQKELECSDIDTTGGTTSQNE